MFGLDSYAFDKGAVRTGERGGGDSVWKYWVSGAVRCERLGTCRVSSGGSVSLR